MLIQQFCTNALPRFEVIKSEDVTSYWVDDDDVGLRTSVDLVSAEHLPGALPRYREPGGTQVSGVFSAPDTPSKRTTLDLFIHKDLYPECAPSLSVYDVVPRNPVRMGDPITRSHDRIETTDSVRQLGRGLLNAALPFVPQYQETLRFVYSKRKWNPDEFRGFRLDVQYPVVGAQYIMRFPVPPRPE